MPSRPWLRNYSCFLVLLAACGEKAAGSAKPATERDADVPVVVTPDDASVLPEEDAAPADKPDAGPEPAAILTVDRATFDFGRVLIGSDSEPASFALANTGTAPSAPLVIGIAGDITQRDAFRVLEDQCTNARLEPGATCLMRVIFRPASSDLFQATLEAGDTGVALSGLGYTPGALSHPGDVTFADTRVGASSSASEVRVRNTGESSTGALAVTLGGADVSEFVIASDGCSGKALEPAAECTVSVRFAPTARGARLATLEFSAQPGGAVSLYLGGNGTEPARLTGPAALAFGGVEVHDTGKTRPFDLMNNGGERAASITFAFEGADAEAFSVDQGECAKGLDADQRCTAHITFAPLRRGLHAATLVVGGALRVDLSGAGGEAVVLHVDTLGDGEGTVSAPNGVLACGSRCEATLLREDDDPTVTLTATPKVGSTFEGWSEGSCGSSDTCQVTLSMSKSVSATFKRKIYKLKVLVRSLAGGQGKLGSAPAGIACDGACEPMSATFAHGTRVRLAVTDHAGSLAHFNGDCSAPSDVCDLTMVGDSEVIVTLSGANYAFVTSTHVNGAMGGLAGADTFCMRAAASANLPGTFRAFLSTSTVHARDRFAFARGFITVEGTVVADSLNTGALLAPINRTEQGNAAFSLEHVWTGSTNEGKYDGGACTDWTSRADDEFANAGRADSIEEWCDASDTLSCSQLPCVDHRACDWSHALYCLGVDLDHALPASLHLQ